MILNLGEAAPGTWLLKNGDRSQVSRHCCCEMQGCSWEGAHRGCREPQAGPLAANIGAGLHSIPQPEGAQLCPYVDEQVTGSGWASGRKSSCQHLDLALGGTCRATAPTPQGCGSILLSACSSLLTRSHSSGKPPR